MNTLLSNSSTEAIVAMCLVIFVVLAILFVYLAKSPGS